MEPVVTPAEMAAIDRAAPEPLEVLIERAGWAVARAAVALVGGRYGARVLVLAGKGNNGNDGRVAARILTGEGMRCRVEPPDYQPPRPQDFDLVIDAAYGTGLKGRYQPPDLGPGLALGNQSARGAGSLSARGAGSLSARGAGSLSGEHRLRGPRAGPVPVLAVDIPSGVDGLTGQTEGPVLRAAATVTFGALKPGLLLAPGRGLAGPVTVAGLGLDCGPGCRAWHLGADDLARWPLAGPAAHKWQRAVWVIGGHDSMLGAPSLAAAGAARAGAGYVAVSIPGRAVRAATGWPVPVEAVHRRLSNQWGADVVAQQHRFAALVVGPGLATDRASQAEVLAVVAGTGDRGLVLDGGALDAVAAEPAVLRRRAVPAVLTPHDGELRRILGHPPGPNRIDTARRLAAELGAVVLSKGPTTVAAHPDGRVLVSTAGDQRLASAGTGDVLAGLVGAALAGGLEPLAAAGLAAELHGRAAGLGHGRGFMAGDLPLLVAHWLDAEPGSTARWRDGGPGSTARWRDGGPELGSPAGAGS